MSKLQRVLHQAAYAEQHYLWDENKICMTELMSILPLLLAQGYGWDIATAEGGWGLDKVLQFRQHTLNGISNEITLY